MIKRRLFQDLKNHSAAREISLIIGPRQVGKTTLMKELENHLKQQGERTIFLNLDFETDKPFFASQESLVRKLDLELGKKPGFVFIDEIQRKENAGLFLKGIYDLNLPYKFIASGSGSLELKEKIHESLAGRKRLFKLNPIGFGEFSDFKTEYRYSEKLNDFFAVEQKRGLHLFSDYLNFGGYPRVILEEKLSEKIRTIDEIFRSYIEKDIAYLLGIERSDVFGSLIKILASQCGQILKYSKLAKEAGVSVSTLKNYLWYAEKTFSIRTITPFFRNKRKEITKSPMVYFYDLGLRNFAIGLFGNLNQPNQLGFVFQNFVANELAERISFTSRELHFWRTLDKAEVDFVISEGEAVMPIEAKYARLKKPELSRSLRNFINRYQPAEARVINLSLREKVKVGKTAVRFVPFYDFQI